jgi:hypothetical protein
MRTHTGEKPFGCSVSQSAAFCEDLLNNNNLAGTELWQALHAITEFEEASADEESMRTGGGGR